MQNSIKRGGKTVYVYIDESGDLGFSEKSSKMFIIAYLITFSPNSLRTRIERFRKRLRSTRRRKRFNIREFKFSRDRDEIRVGLLRLLADLDIDIGYIVVDKRYVKKDLRESPPILYNFLVIHYIVHNIVIRYQPGKIVFVIDKSLSKEAREAFDEYFRRKLAWKANVEFNIQLPKHEVKHVDSQDEPCLQAADYLAGAAFAKFERGEPKYFKIIEDKIVFRNSWGEVRW